MTDQTEREALIADLDRANTEIAVLRDAHRAVTEERDALLRALAAMDARLMAIESANEVEEIKAERDALRDAKVAKSELDAAIAASLLADTICYQEDIAVALAAAALWRQAHAPKVDITDATIRRFGDVYHPRQTYEPERVRAALDAALNPEKDAEH